MGQWMRFWPIPAYGVAFFIHKRYRVWRPRRLPTITPLKLPEIYSVYALMHWVDIEADRMVEKLNKNRDLRVICAVSQVLRERLNAQWCRGHVQAKDTQVDLSLRKHTPRQNLRDRKSTRLNSSHSGESRMPSSA